MVYLSRLLLGNTKVKLIIIGQIRFFEVNLRNINTPSLSEFSEEEGSRARVG